ncbi:MAG TPA: FAD-binding protein [Kiritimatiellia bacterium]|nr:FAD-binding protein [Kiritimatiellia bacterium]
MKQTCCHTLVIGSGAAGLQAAVQLRRRGIDTLMVTEGLRKGTSINTGSDKQTYYKLGLCGAEPDSVFAMARALMAAGGMHGDLAVAEAAGSVQAFAHLVALGVPFPRDAYGQFPGYKTDHDPARRATSTGPYTSRDMCVALLREVRRLGVPIHERRSVTSLLVCGSGARRRVCGALALDATGTWQAYRAENVVFAVGGFGGLYAASAYPACHLGSIGLAFRAGATACNLPDSQYGLASIRPRWNVSGSYMQVVPRLISTAADGHSDEREFLLDACSDPAQAYSLLFLKGYQWPFDARRAETGSSWIDRLVYDEREVKGRRVFLDFRRDPTGFRLDVLSEEPRSYLTRSGATGRTPFVRLRKLNPDAAAFYAARGVDLARQPLEIALCAQHNNGGLAASLEWESINLAHFFPVGEVNGSHGVGRPGGSALNAGQVGAMRAAESIAARYAGVTLSDAAFETALAAAYAADREYEARCRQSRWTWQACRHAFQQRMSRYGAHVRQAAVLERAVAEAQAQVRRLEREGCRAEGPSQKIRAFENRQLCTAHAVYLSAMAYSVRSGVGSRGSSLVVDEQGVVVPEDPSFRAQVLETRCVKGRGCQHRWRACRPLPAEDFWFETVWEAFRRRQRNAIGCTNAVLTP